MRGPRCSNARSVVAGTRYRPSSHEHRSEDGDVETFAEKRRRMVEEQIAARGVVDRTVLDAMFAVPRQMFVPAAAARFAYEGTAVPHEEGQTISQPLCRGAH